MMPKTSYDATDDFGVLYDQVPAYVARSDVSFYLQEAAETGTPSSTVLELGCGTGRLLLPVARSGHRVAGIDSSSSMLERCRAKLALETPETQARVTLRQADVRDFSVPIMQADARDGGFALAIAPFRVLQHLTAPSDQLRCLATIRQHLRPGGRLVFDVFNPHYPLMTLDRTAEVEETPELEMVDGRFMRRAVRVLRVNWREQTSDVELIYYVRAAGGVSQRTVQAFPMRWFGPAELEHLLARAGFRVTVMYGNFDRGPLRDESPEIIVVAERDQ